MDKQYSHFSLEPYQEQEVGDDYNNYDDMQSVDSLEPTPKIQQKPKLTKKGEIDKRSINGKLSIRKAQLARKIKLQEPKPEQDELVIFKTGRGPNKPKAKFIEQQQQPQQPQQQYYQNYQNAMSVPIHGYPGSNDPSVLLQLQELKFHQHQLLQEQEKLKNKIKQKKSQKQQQQPIVEDEYTVPEIQSKRAPVPRPQGISVVEEQPPPKEDIVIQSTKDYQKQKRIDQLKRKLTIY